MKIGTRRARSRHALAISATRRPASSRRLVEALSMSVLLGYLSGESFLIVYSDTASNVETEVKFQFFSSLFQSKNVEGGIYCKIDVRFIGEFTADCLGAVS